MLQCDHCGQSHDPSTRFCPETGRLIAARLLPPGSLLEGKYRIGRVLGLGGMGAVFEATHKILGHKVAVKVLLPELSRDPTMTSRLVREGRAASATGHPNIAMVTDMGSTEDGALFVVMEYLEGCTLDAIVDGAGPLTVPRAASIVVQLLSGLEAVHQASIVHRDLKPENVMVVRREDREVIKILDFGISKMVDDELKQELTSTGLIIGTPAFMAPEQSRGAADVDHRADIYSAGAIFYKLLTGMPPVTAPNVAQLLARLLQGEIEPPSRKRPGVPESLDRVIMRALALRPGDRYPDARSFRGAVEPFCSDAVFIGPAAVGPAAGPAAPTFSVSDSFGDLSDEALVALDEVGDGAAAAGAAPVGMSASLAAATRPPPAAASPTAVAPGPPPPAPPAAADEDRFDERSFAPADDDERLELVHAPRIRNAPPAAAYGEDEVSAVAPLPGGSARRSARHGDADGRRRILLLAGGAVVVLAGLFFFFSGGEETAPATPELQIVTISLETEPAQVDVFVDGVQQVDLPIRLPRSERPFSVRVQAPGHRAKTFSVVPRQDRRLRVTLTPLATP